MKLRHIVESWVPWHRRQAREADLERELRDHLDLEAEEQQEAGLSPEDASYAAKRALGNVVKIKEEVRMAWGFQWLETLLQDLRYGLRQLRRTPGFTAVAVITLALGIGANTAIFSVVNGILLKPLPYPHPERLVDVRLNLRGIHQSNCPLSAGDYFIYREQSRTFEAIGLYTGDSVNVTSSGQPEHLAALRVTDGLVPILGIPPLFGRSFTPADDQPGSPDTVMLTYGYWRREFGDSTSMIGKTLDVNGKPHTIIGVCHSAFASWTGPMWSCSCP